MGILINNLAVYEAHYLPGMIERGWGRVQNIASDAAVVTPVERRSASA